MCSYMFCCCSSFVAVYVYYNIIPRHFIQYQSITCIVPLLSWCSELFPCKNNAWPSWFLVKFVLINFFFSVQYFCFLKLYSTPLVKDLLSHYFVVAISKIFTHLHQNVWCVSLLMSSGTLEVKRPETPTINFHSVFRLLTEENSHIVSWLQL